MSDRFVRFETENDQEDDPDGPILVDPAWVVSVCGRGGSGSGVPMTEINLAGGTTYWVRGTTREIMRKLGKVEHDA